MKQVKLLVVEDDELLTKSLNNVLSKDFELEFCDNYTHAEEYAYSNQYDLMLLDIVFKNDIRTGLDLFKKLRQNGIEVPTIFITGKESINYKIGAFKAGADDYICKPFNALELKARINVVLKRYQKSSNEESLEYGDIRIDKDTFTAYRKDRPLKLRRKEFEILEFLIVNSNKVVSREKLLDTLWANDEPVETNTLDVHIKNLRSKVGKDYIKTVYGIGYTLV